MKLLLAALGLLASVLCVSAQITAAQAALLAPKVIGGAGCTTIYDSNYTATSTVYPIGQTSGDVYGGQYSYVPASNVSICGVALYMTKAGDISGKTYTAYIYSSAANSFTPGSPIGTSDTIAGNNSWSSTEVKFTFSSTVAITTSGTYVYVVKCNQAADAANYVQFDLSSAGGIGGFVGTWDISGVLQSGFSTQDAKGKLYIP